MIRKEQNLAVEKMLQKEQREDAAQPVLLARITREGDKNLKEERQEPFQEKKIKDYMVGLRGEDSVEGYSKG